MSKAARILCRSLGCKHERDPGCTRCNAGIYDPDFCEYGWLDPLLNAWWRFRRWLRKLGPKRCDVCGKKYRHGYDENTCSAECFDEWLPF